MDGDLRHNFYNFKDLALRQNSVTETCSLVRTWLAELCVSALPHHS
jgi:hypothetical protein